MECAGPDVATRVRAKSEYRQRHPRAGELLLVVEVADTTLRYDSTAKRDLYARAGDTASGQYYVGKWDGTNWSELGSGTDRLHANGEIVAICSDAAGK